MYPLNIPGIGTTNPHIYEEKQQQINSFIFSHCLNIYKENLHVCTYVQKCVIVDVLITIRLPYSS